MTIFGWLFLSAFRIVRSIPDVPNQGDGEILLLAENSFPFIFAARFFPFLIEVAFVLAVLVPVYLFVGANMYREWLFTQLVFSLAAMFISTVLILRWYLLMCPGRRIRLGLYVAGTICALASMPAWHSGLGYAAWLVGYGAFLLVFVAVTPSRDEVRRAEVNGRARRPIRSLEDYVGFGMGPLARVVISPVYDALAIFGVGAVTLLITPWAGLIFIPLGGVLTTGYVAQVVRSGCLDDLRLAGFPVHRVARSMMWVALIRGAVVHLLVYGTLALIFAHHVTSTGWRWWYAGLLIASCATYASVIAMAMQYGLQREHPAYTGLGLALGVPALTASLGMAGLGIADKFLLSYLPMETWVAIVLTSISLVHVLVVVLHVRGYGNGIYLRLLLPDRVLSSREWDAEKYALYALAKQYPGSIED